MTGRGAVACAAVSHAYQVERSKFDEILLNNARRNGVRVLEECAVVDVTEHDDRVTGVRYRDAAGDEHEVKETSGRSPPG